jgi:hypothetical protein
MTGHVGWQKKMDWKFRIQLARTGFIFHLFFPGGGFQTILVWRHSAVVVQSVNDVTEEMADYS